MTTALTEERLEEIRAYQLLSQSHHVHDLLAEVDRLRGNEALLDGRLIQVIDNACRSLGLQGDEEDQASEDQVHAMVGALREARIIARREANRPISPGGLLAQELAAGRAVIAGWSWPDEQRSGR